MAGGTDIESAIFSNIEAATGETFGEPSDVGDEQYQDTDTQPATKRVARDGDDPELDQTRQQLRSRGRPSQEEDQNLDRQRREPKPPKGQERTDQRGKQTDEFGNVVGSNSYHVTRRLKSQLDNQRDANQGLRTQVDNLTRQLAEVQVLNDLPKQLGLSNTDTAELLQLSAVLKSNPTEGARKVIEIAIAKGANLKDIINDEFIPSITLNATQRLLDERLGPIVKERKERQDVTQDDLDAQTQARQFMADYPDAVLHNEVIVDQMQKVEAEYASRGQKVSKYIAAEKAYQRLEDFCARNQLDISQPLAPQLQERERQQQGAGNRRPGERIAPTRQPARPLPNGSNGGGEPISRRNRQADSDDSYSSIVREALAEEGYQF